MGKKIPTFSKLALSVFVVIFALSFISFSGSNGFLKSSVAEAAGPAVDNPGIQKAMEVQGRHSESLMGIPGVVGHGIGVSSDGEAVIKIFAARAGIPGIPAALEGVQTKVEVTGMVVAYMDPTATFDRPVPIGVSTGHPDITAGTIGCRVKDASGNVYALSNNHVYANGNNAEIGDNVLQPGPYDGGQDPAHAIGTLSDYVAIDFSGGTNTVDAAIALTSADELGTSTPGAIGVNGYGTPSSTIASAYAGQGVQKNGRTTGWTHGEVVTIDSTVDVCYEVVQRGPFLRCATEARFVGQIAITSTTADAFSAGGDSGSLIVTEIGNNPVGLLFAGGGDFTFANPIGLVLESFEVDVDDGNSSVNIRPTAYFTYADSLLIVDFADQSSDSDGYIASWSWNFGDSSTSTVQNPSHTYAADGTYTVTLTVTDDAGGTDSISQDVTVDDGINADPTADFTYAADGFTVDFADQSSDSDGYIASWSWNFGDSSTSTVQNPSHTYAADGTYTVTLTVTDDAGGTDSASKVITVSGEAGTIALTATGYKVRGRKNVDLEWSGATEPNVDIYRDGELITTTSNDGAYTDITTSVGGGSYTYQVCEEGTFTCSNEATVTF